MNQLINVEFSVKEIVLEDRYEIILKAKYETNVPAPVLIVEPMMTNLPIMKKGDVFRGELLITNYGLIDAQNVKARLPKGDNYTRFDFLTAIPDKITSNQVIVVPFKITALQDFSNASNGGASGGSCGTSLNYSGAIENDTPCPNGKSVASSASFGMNHASGGGNCSSSGSSNIHYRSGNGGGVSSPNVTYTPSSLQGGTSDELVCAPVMGDDDDSQCE